MLYKKLDKNYSQAEFVPAPLPDGKKTRSDAGFTLIELLVVISIMAFLTVMAIFSFNSLRMQSRDALRSGNAAALSRALAMYINDMGDYPVSPGECLSSSGTGGLLMDTEVIVKIPSDPLWSDSPSNFNGGATKDYAVSPSIDYCYWYYSSNGKDYYISYLLETSSKSGVAGPHVITSAGAQN